ncbi:oxidoreductase domain-containing protein [Melanomma pulvis-pyrius CBS 109.77]|uniref:D-xylose 1-dehydrogenase (NADP(+), D-xylono-1,5-lactone-forming) n=1 Tax=Melanomma pulvis-pyrius CBS 109.77 TaxID=1314802 RepID=A0A6A6X4P9_9PLEO|nr:oxidoreductase domain-containing protein [Melanomma pulvis-pyrius CBS 109.77]
MMFSTIHSLKRLYTTIFDPPVAVKSSDALRFGILGAASIAPQALIVPAKSHHEVFIAAIAARDIKKAEAFAKKHCIPTVHKTYDDLIADPQIDCIYIPLPNGLHYEWAVKALSAGKHVLLEKPSVSNATEAKSLFRKPLLSRPDAPVLLEAFHYTFHPAWQLFKTLFDPQDVETVDVINSLVAGFFPLDDIRWNYKLSGGSLMDFGSYSVSAVRSIFAAEPTGVRDVTYRPMPAGFDQECDQAIYATYDFPNGGTAKISVDLQARGGYWFPALTKNWPSFANSLPTLTVKLRSKKADSQEGYDMYLHKTIVVHCYVGPHFYHRIDVTTTATIKDTYLANKIVKVEDKKEHLKAYKWPAGEEGKKGEEWWSTYRYQLEEFVNRVKKRDGSGVWVEGEDSIKQMEMIDATYVEAGLPLRPTSDTLG